MSLNWKKINRKTHYWGSILCAIPIVIVIATGILLILKKEIEWVQPPSAKGSGKTPQVNFQQILSVSKTVPAAGIQSWSDIDRLDVRPNKGIIKIRAKNQWEIQVDHQTLEILQVALRRSDFIESIHDGSYFHPAAKLGIFLPCAIILFILCLTGLYLFFKTYLAKRQASFKRFLVNEV